MKDCTAVGMTKQQVIDIDVQGIKLIQYALGVITDIWWVDCGTKLNVYLAE